MAKLAEVIKVFSPGEKLEFNLLDAIHTFEGRAPEACYTEPIDWGGIADHYQLPDKMGDWDFQKGTKEQVLNIKNPEALKIGHTLDGNWITYYDVLAARNGDVNGGAFNSLATSGLALTKDNYLIIGVRGGEITPERVKKIGAGLFGPTPAGSTSFKKSYDEDPITDTLVAEFEEELGKFGVEKTYPVGVYNSLLRGPTGVKVAGIVETDATLKQLEETNRIANLYYAHLIEKGASRQEAESDLRRVGLPPDAWEHSQLRGVPHDPSTIDYFLRERERCFTGIGAGALMTYQDFLTSRRE